MMDMDGFKKANEYLWKAREQADSVRGKDTPYRMEYRYKGGSTSWRYFTNIDDALAWEDMKVYCTFGYSFESPRWSQLQKIDENGNWKKHSLAA